MDPANASPKIHAKTPSISNPADLETAPIQKESRTDITTALDPFLVAFDEPYDAENPLDWPTSRKWLTTNILSATKFNRIMVSTIMAPALSTIAGEFDMSSTEAAMSMSIYLLATAFGPLFIGPLSEIYGRQVVLHFSNVWFLVWNLVCGFSANKETLIASRFLAGFGASAINALTGGVLGDVWRAEQRGRSLGIYYLIPLLGAAVGPIIGGFIVGRTTWRWIFWAPSIFQFVLSFTSFFAFPETYGVLILRRRAARLRQQAGDTQYYTQAEKLDGERSNLIVLAWALTRPLRLLTFHPIIQVAAILSGFIYGIMYIVFTTFSDLWTSQYHQSVEISGLHYIACTVGELIASQIGGPLMDSLYHRQPEKTRTPESRIPLTFPSILIAWSGMIFYGWIAAYRLHWPLVDFGVVIMLFGTQLTEMSIAAYVIDSYKEHTSSAMAATQFIQSLAAFLFPLFAPSMYKALGYGWANGVLALVGSLLAFPLSAFIWKCGVKLRTKAASTY